VNLKYGRFLCRVSHGGYHENYCRLGCDAVFLVYIYIYVYRCEHSRGTFFFFFPEETAGSFEMLSPIYQTTRCYIKENINIKEKFPFAQTLRHKT
jgi:hypothetical protein